MATTTTSADPAIAKEIKQQLKQARELLTQKDHAGALKICEAIVKKDKNCYTAWLMIAASAQELKQFNQAQCALYKAIELDENQPVAYQGLVQLGERAPNLLTESDMISAYRKLCMLTRPTDPTKFYDHAKKYIEFLKLQIERESNTNSYYQMQLIELCKEILDEKRLQLNQDDEQTYRLMTVNMLESLNVIPTNLNEFLCSCYFWLSQSSSDRGQRLNYYEKFIRTLCQTGRPSSDIVDYCNECLTLFPNSNIAQNVLIIILLETLVPRIYDLMAPVAKLTDALNRFRQDESNPSSGPYICGKAFFAIRDRKFSNALESLLSIDPESDGRHIVLLLQMICYAHMHIIKSTKETITLARTKLTNFIVKESVSSVESLIDLCLAMVTHDEGRYEKAIEMFNKIIQVANQFRHRAFYGQFESYMISNKPIEARICYESMQDRLDSNENLSCQLQLNLIENHPIDVIKIMHNATKEAFENDESLELTVQGWLTVGRAYLAIHHSNDMFDASLCKSAFDKAIELDEYLWESYACLSTFYNEVEQRLSEVLAYAKRAFELNENIESVQMNYVDTLLQTEQISEALTILERILEIDHLKTWGHFRFGLISIRLNNIFASMKALQIVCRRPPVSGTSWSALGDTHLHTNNIKSALSCYNKATNLERETLYSLTRQAYAMGLIGRHEESIRIFDQVIEQAPKYVLARKGKGEAHLNLALEYVGRYKDQLAIEHVQQSLTAFHDALCLQAEYSCLWKKYGDGCMLLHPINDNLIHIRLPPLTKKFDEQQVKDIDGCILLRKVDLLRRAQKCYMQAIRLKPRSSVYWSCLAQCIYIQNCYRSDNQNLLTQAFDYMKIAVSIKPTDYLIWNALGVIAAHPDLHEAGFAQHCFFKSIQLQRSAVAYSNLGFLYYRHENLQAANRAFSNAQQTDPMYSLAWIGQALVAEKLDYNESIDLYRHCTELSNHSQILFGYGKAIAHLLVRPNDKSTEIYKYAIDYLHGDQRAADALTKFVQRNTQDTCALQCLGIIHEFNRRFSQAANAYQLAFSQMNQQSELGRILQNDYARVKCRSGDIKSSVFVLQNVKMTLLNVLWLAIAYGNTGKRAEAIEILKRMIEEPATSNKDRSILLAFLGCYQREIDPKTAVKNLFESYSIKPICSSTVTILCAMGMLTADTRITSAALKQMPKLTDSEYTMDIHLLTCISMLLTNKVREAYSYAMNATRSYPWLIWTWILALIARIQIGYQIGLLPMIEIICYANFSTIDEKMAILVAKALHRIAPERDERVLHIFQMLIMHCPTLLDLRVSFAHYVKLFDVTLARDLLPKDISL